MGEKKKKKLPTQWSHGLYLFSPTQETGCDVTVIKFSWDSDNADTFGENCEKEKATTNNNHLTENILTTLS